MEKLPFKRNLDKNKKLSRPIILSEQIHDINQDLKNLGLFGKIICI